MTKIINLYGLFSTRDVEIHYIGQTSLTLEKRVKSHIYASKKDNSARGEWIRNEIADGFEIKGILIASDVSEARYEKDLIYTLSHIKKRSLFNTTHHASRKAKQPETRKPLSAMDQLRRRLRAQRLCQNNRQYRQY